TTVTIPASQTVSGIVIKLKKASVLSVRINDNAHALEKKTTEAFPPHVLVGVMDAQGSFHPAKEAQKDNAGISYTVPIPQDFPVRLTVHSAKVQLQDDKKNPVPANGHYEMVVHASSQAQQKAFVFSAVGRKP